MRLSWSSLLLVVKATLFGAFSARMVAGEDAAANAARGHLQVKNR
jgi:hypothetical protein